MIIYGSKAVHLKSAQPPTAVCPSCGQTGTTVLTQGYSKHAHVFWIPLFPIGRIGRDHNVNIANMPSRTVICLTNLSENTIL